jgi:hypothetical protein
MISFTLIKNNSNLYKYIKGLNKLYYKSSLVDGKKKLIYRLFNIVLFKKLIISIYYRKIQK